VADLEVKGFTVLEKNTVQDGVLLFVTACHAPVTLCFVPSDHAQTPPSTAPPKVNPMNVDRVLVLRFWLEPQEDGAGAWRASVLNPVSRQRRYFTDPEDLSQYLLELDPNWPLEPDEPSQNTPRRKR
jgi:hypothetical protein